MGLGTGGPPLIVPVLVTPAALLCSPWALCLASGLQPWQHHPGGCRQVLASPGAFSLQEAARKSLPSP